MKRFSSFINFCLMLIFVSCSKQSDKGNEKLAQNYFKLAYVELSSEEASSYHLKKALGYVEQAIAQDDKPQYVAMKATLLFKLEQYDESLLVYGQALKYCDDACLKTEILNNYACLLAQMGQHDKAFDLFKQLSIDRHYLTPEVALVNLGKMSAEKKELKQAQAYFQQAITMVPSYLDAHFYLAWAAYLNDDKMLARREVKTLLYLDPACKMAQVLEEKLELI